MGGGTNIKILGTNHTYEASKYKTKLAEYYVKKTLAFTGKKIEIYQIVINGIEFEIVDYDKVPDASWNTLAEPRTTVEKDGVIRYIPIRVDTNTIDVAGFGNVEEYRKIKNEYNATSV